MMDQDKFDDFDDIDLDDIEDLDDDWDDFDGDDSAAPSPSQQKKKSSLSGLITLLIILIFVGVGLFILYTTFKPMLQGNGNPAQPPTEVASQNDPVPTTGTSDALPDETFFSQDDGLPPMPTPLASNQPTANEPELTPLPEFDDIELEPLPDLSSNQAPVQQAAPAPIVAPVIDTVAAQQPIDLPETNTAPSQDVTNLSNRLESLQSDMTSQLSERDFRLDLLNEKIDRIEKTMASIESRLSEAKTVPAAVKPRVVPKKVAPKKVVKKSTPSAPKKVKRKTTSKPKKPVVKKVRWTLRSAQPGKATVSPTGSSDIRSISVGETLSGIGRIQSISNASGKWVVTGTTGKVSQ